MIADKESDAALGTISVDMDAEGTGVLSYWIARAHWGRGVAKEAVAALLRHATGRPTLRRLITFTDPDSLRSQRVLLASGFTDPGFTDRPQPTRRGSTQQRNYEFPIGR